MSEILSKTDASLHGPDAIKSDKPANGYTYVDLRGNVQSVNADSSFGSNFENVLGPEYLAKMAGSSWEAIWKTAATMIPAGKTIKAAIALTAAKIGTKSIGTAGNYVITGEYTAGKAIKKALIINAATPTNYAPIATAAFAKNTVVGKTFGSYYKTLSGDGKSSNLLQKGRIDYVEFHTPKWLGHQHLHGSIYPLNPLLQAESKVFGYGAYNVISGKNPFEVAHANQIHSNDVQHNSNVNETHHQGAGQHGDVKSHAQAEPKSGGHHEEAAYQGGLLPWSVEVTRALSDKVKSGYQDGISVEAGIDKEFMIWNNKVNSAVGLVDKTAEYIKGVPSALGNTILKDVVYLNRYVGIPILNLLASGIAESTEAIDKALVNVGNYGLAAGNIAAAKLATRGGGGAKNPFDEIQIITNARGVTTTKIVPKIRQDNTRATIEKPKDIKLLKNVKAEQAENTKKFGVIIDRLKAANVERATGIKVGTVGNPLAGQPFANNTPQLRNSVFNNYSSGRTTISQTK